MTAILTDTFLSETYSVRADRLGITLIDATPTKKQNPFDDGPESGWKITLATRSKTIKFYSFHNSDTKPPTIGHVLEWIVVALRMWYCEVTYGDLSESGVDDVAIGRTKRYCRALSNKLKQLLGVDLYREVCDWYGDATGLSSDSLASNTL